MCLLWEMFFKVFGSGQSDVRSGTSMTTCCVVNANRVFNIAWQIKIWIFLPSDSLPIAPERCLELSSWMSVFRMFASRIMPKRLVKQWKEGFKKTGRTLSENGRPGNICPKRNDTGQNGRVGISVLISRVYWPIPVWMTSTSVFSTQHCS